MYDIDLMEYVELYPEIRIPYRFIMVIDIKR